MSCLSSCWQALFSFLPPTAPSWWPFRGGRVESRVIINGLDAAGKTTILYNLKLGEVVTTIPTIGFNVEQVTCRNVTFTAWDVGGKDKIRPLWRHYFLNSDALIFVVDCNDRERLAEAREELQRNMREETLQGVPLLVLANKQDLPKSVSAAELANFFRLHTLRDRQWTVQPCCAIHKSCGDLHEGLSWLAAQLHPRSAAASSRHATTGGGAETAAESNDGSGAHHHRVQKSGLAVKPDDDNANAKLGPVAASAIQVVGV